MYDKIQLEIYICLVKGYFHEQNPKLSICDSCKHGVHYSSVARAATVITR